MKGLTKEYQSGHRNQVPVGTCGRFAHRRALERRGGEKATALRDAQFERDEVVLDEVEEEE